MSAPTALKTLNTADLGGSAPVHDLSMIGLFMQADIVVQLVMLLLFVASVWCWAIIFGKLARFKC